MQQCPLCDNASYTVIADKDLYNLLLPYANKDLQELVQGDSKLLLLPGSTTSLPVELNGGHVFDISPVADNTTCDIKLGDNNSDICKFRLSTNNFAGFFSIGNTQFNILSRFANAHDEQETHEDFFLQYILQKVLQLNLLTLESSTKKDSIFNLLLLLFASFLHDALYQGLYKEYRKFQYNDSKLKGVLNVNRYLKYDIPFNGCVAYDKREFSYNNTMTKLIRHTIEYMKTQELGRSVLSSTEVKADVAQILSVTPDYCRQEREQIIKANLKPFRHPYFTRYKQLQHLCLMILRHEKMKYAENSQQINGLLFDVAWLWEEYLAKLLVKIGFTHPNNRQGIKGIYLAKNTYTNSSCFKRYPDFYLPSAQDATYINCVADAKYKSQFDNIHDVNQLITYMYYFNTKRGVLILPQSDKDKDSQTYKLVKHHGVNEDQLIEYRFKIPSDAKTYQDFAFYMKASEDELVAFMENVGA